LRADVPGAAARALESSVPRLIALDDVDGPVVLGCSGGADSLALLVLLRTAGYSVCAVYVDHGLRPTELDVATVERAAARFGAAFVIREVDVARRGNLEARARDLRYRALEQVRTEIGAAAIAVAHTRDDQAETVLLNLLRGSGTRGLAGIAPERGVRRRPILRFRRSETRELCALLRLEPVHDEMNDDRHFRRAWLRREVIPLLEAQADRDLTEVLGRQADAVRDDDELLDAQAGTLVVPGRPVIAAELAAAPVALARRAVRQWLGHPAPSFAHVESVLAVARGELRAVELPARRVERSRGLMHVRSDPVRRDAPVALALPGRATFGQFEFDAWVERAPPAAWPDGRHVAVFDADRLGAAVNVEPPRVGARFRPLGRSGSKLVADALREAGVAASARVSHPIVTDAASDVCWVVGYRIGEHVKVTARTRRFLWIAAEPLDDRT
jgi:tRNA(Ile)-lysidine synthase